MNEWFGGGEASKRTCMIGKVVIAEMSWLELGLAWLQVQDNNKHGGYGYGVE